MNSQHPTPGGRYPHAHEAGEGREVPNLFVSLNHWARKQAENFLTESFALVLRFIQRGDPPVFSRLISNFTERRHSEARTDASISRRSFGNDQPDLTIKDDDHMTVFEVKLEADLGEGQLGRYRKSIASEGKSTTLVLLTRYHVEPPPDQMPDVRLRWFEVSRCLQDELPSVQSPEVRFLVLQFVAFLRALNMGDVKITSALEDGLRSAIRVLNIIRDALDQEGVSMDRKRKNLTEDWMGWVLGDMEFGIGLSLNQPSDIEFEDLRKKQVEAVLNLADGGFYAATPPEQQKRIEEWVKSCVDHHSDLRGRRPRH